VAQVEWHECVSVIDGIQFLSFHELLQVVLDNWALVDSCSLGSSGVNTDAISKGKDVFESLVLESVRVDINNSFTVGNA
jgi:hypothetical protein